MAKITPLKTTVSGATPIIEKQGVTIKPPNFATATVTLKSTAPYLQNRFSSKAQEEMIEKQKAGSSKARTRKAKPPKNFEEKYLGSMHKSSDGWYGIPATAIRNSMIDACRLTEIDMIRAKMCIRILEDGLDSENLEPLVKLKGKPEMHLDRVKIGMNQTDIVARGMFKEWTADVRIRWDADVFTGQDVINLISRAGWQVGIGAGRPLSKTSAGTGKGTWEVVGASAPESQQA